MKRREEEEEVRGEMINEEEEEDEEEEEEEEAAHVHLSDYRNPEKRCPKKPFCTFRFKICSSLWFLMNFHNVSETLGRCRCTCAASSSSSSFSSSSSSSPSSTSSSTSSILLQAPRKLLAGS